MAKIGLMGGSFDPVHFGHLTAARNAMDQHGLDKVILLPAAQTPPKSTNPTTTNPTTAGHHRVAMLRSAIDSDQRLEVSDFEVVQGEVSYTIETVRHFRERYPDDALFWIIGTDKVPTLDRWRSIEELAQMVEFISIERPGHPIKDHPSTPGLNLHRCKGQAVGISSTELRDRQKNGLSLDGIMPSEAIVYTRKHGLYTRHSP